MFHYFLYFKWGDIEDACWCFLHLAITLQTNTNKLG